MALPAALKNKRVPLMHDLAPAAAPALALAA